LKNIAAFLIKSIIRKIKHHKKDYQSATKIKKIVNDGIYEEFWVSKDSIF